tara:strand:- start:59303 stop:61639 length:2337 start_codon:yes stop_codon:yes gene_type:complete
MPTINRYSKPTIARYNPESLQEMMIAPTYMREQHDNLDVARGEMESQLAQYDSNNIHSDALRAEQENLYNQMQMQGDKLEREGFSPSSKSDFLRFNKGYQQSVGPKGVIGQISSAKEAYDIEKETYITNATAAGFSPDSAADNWADHSAKYDAKYGEDKKVEDIGGLYAPSYKNAVDEFKAVLKDRGLDSSDITKIRAGIKWDEKEGSYVLTEEGRTAAAGDAANIDAAITWINEQIVNPNTTIGASLLHNRQTPEDVLDEISGLGNVYKNSSYVNKDSETITGRMAPPKPSKANGADPSKTFYTHNSQTTPIGTNFSELKANAEQVLSSKTSFPKDIAVARSVERLTTETEAELQMDPQYNMISEEIDNLYSSEKFYALPDRAQQLLRDFPAGEDVFEHVQLLSGAAFQKGEDGKNLSLFTDEHGTRLTDDQIWDISDFVQNEFTTIKEKQDVLSNMRDATISQKGFERTTVVVPYDKTSERSLLQLNSLQAYSMDNVKPGEIIFYDNDGTNKSLDMSEDAAGKAMGLFTNAKPSDINSIQAAKQGTETGFVIKFNPAKGSSLNPTTAAGNEEDFDGTQSLEIFIPVTDMYDNITGARSTQSMFVDMQPPAVQAELRKFINTQELSTSPSFETLGKPDTFANKYFQGLPDDMKIDFLDAKSTSRELLGTSKNNGVIPYLIDSEGNKNPMKWNNFIPFGDLNTQEAAVKNIINSGVYKAILNNAMQERALVRQFKLDTNNPDNIGLLHHIRERNVRLSNPSDIYTLGMYHNTSVTLKK